MQTSPVSPPIEHAAFERVDRLPARTAIKIEGLSKTYTSKYGPIKALTQWI